MVYILATIGLHRWYKAFFHRLNNQLDKPLFLADSKYDQLWV